MWFHPGLAMTQDDAKEALLELTSRVKSGWKLQYIGWGDYVFSYSRKKKESSLAPLTTKEIAQLPWGLDQ